jgi:hypothetical protein
MNIIFVFSNKKKGKSHTSIFKLYPLRVQLRLRKSKGGREFLLMRYKKHYEAGNKEMQTNILLTRIILVNLVIVHKHNSKIINAKIFHKNHLCCTTTAPNSHIENWRPTC